MSPAFYCLSFILTDYFGRLASAMRERELRELPEFFDAIARQAKRGR